MNKAINLNQIPLLCQLNIVKFLPLQTLLHLSLVNREWRQACLPLLSTHIRVFWEKKEDKIRFLSFLSKIRDFVSSLNFNWFGVNSPLFFNELFAVLHICLKPKIKKLQLPKNSSLLTGKGFYELAAILELFPTLHSLDCFGFYLAPESDFKVIDISHFNNLTTLAFPEFDIQFIDAISLFSNLHVLQNLSCIASSHILLALMTTSLINKLISWHIYKCIGEVRVPLIVALENAIELRKLTLVYDSLTYHHQHLQALTLNQKIKDLSIIDNDSTFPSGLLGFFSENPQLTSFSVKFNSFSDPMIKALVNCCQFLSRICLHNTYVTSEGFRYLLQNSKHLTHIDISIGSIYAPGPSWIPEPWEFPCLSILKTLKLTVSSSLLVSLMKRVFVESELSELSLSTLHSSSQEDLSEVLEFLSSEFQFGEPNFKLTKLSIFFYPEKFHYILNTRLENKRSLTVERGIVSEIYEKSPQSDILLEFIIRKYPSLQFFESVLNVSSEALSRFKKSNPSVLTFNNLQFSLI